MTLMSLGAILLELRRFAEAITAHQEAASIFRETGDQHSLGGALHNLGRTLEEMRRFDEAITAHRHAAALYRQAGDQHGEDWALNNLERARAART